MGVKENVLKIVGKEGALTEARYLQQAKDSGHPHFIAFAQDYANTRKSYIDDVQKGLYADYGITEKDIFI